MNKKKENNLAQMREQYPHKFVSEELVFNNIHKGDCIFISTACAEPQYLVNSMIKYVENHPKAFFDTEILHVWTLGVAPYAKEKFKSNFRHNSFFIGDNTRDSVNEGFADYTPIFLSEVPDLFMKGLQPVDVALIQTSLPDQHGYMNIGVSVDIVKAAIEVAGLVIAQVNPRMPRIHGDGFIHIDDIDFVIEHEEPLLEFPSEPPSDIVRRIGGYVSQLVEDGDTIQVGYGSIPNAVLSALSDKKHLGVHTELLGDGLVELIKKGVVDNSRKKINRGKSIASFSMGSSATYEFLHDNPCVEFRSIKYTNDPMVIARHENMVAINSALEIDLTGQASAESLGKTFYSGIGGQADFMRGAILAPNGKTILALQSTAQNETVSRIVPFLQSGAGVTLNRGDIHYVITEYGIAHIHGKNIRERAMDLIAIAHPKFRPQLIKEAKKHNIIYKDQAFIPGKRGEYPEELETYRTSKNGLEVLLRPVRINDEPALKDFFYSLSDQSLHRRFISMRNDIPHERLQEFTVIDYTREMMMVAVLGSEEKEREMVIGLGQYAIEELAHTANVAFVVRDEFQNSGVGQLLLEYLTYLAKRQGLLGFTAEVLVENRPMMKLFQKMGYDIHEQLSEGIYELKMAFRG